MVNRQRVSFLRNSFTARDAETGEEKPFFNELFFFNHYCVGENPIFGQIQGTEPYCLIGIISKNTP